MGCKTHLLSAQSYKFKMTAQALDLVDVDYGQYDHARRSDETVCNKK